MPDFDKYDHYQRAVQSPPHTCNLLMEIWGTKKGRPKPRILREDFSGTFANSMAWVQRSPRNVAIAVDNDPEPLAYGVKAVPGALNRSQQKRLSVYQADVRYTKFPMADMIYAFNYSCGYFLHRPALKDYFKKCLPKLRAHGMLVIDCLMDSNKDRSERKVGDFTYVWQRHSFDVLSRHARYAIHFERPGEAPRLDTFTYDWRMWTPAELNDCLLEVAFSEVTFFVDDRQLANPRVVHVAARV